MSEMQVLLETLLTNRINDENLKQNKDFSEISNIMNIFLADNSITTTQYAKLAKLIILANTTQSQDLSNSSNTVS
jgi:hypothetical protein